MERRAGASRAVAHSAPPATRMAVDRSGRGLWGALASFEGGCWTVWHQGTPDPLPERNARAVARLGEPSAMLHGWNAANPVRRSTMPELRARLPLARRLRDEQGREEGERRGRGPGGAGNRRFRLARNSPHRFRTDFSHRTVTAHGMV
jgi:hypothetical protein